MSNFCKSKYQTSQVLQKLSSLAQNMSEKTKKMHLSLVRVGLNFFLEVLTNLLKALTYHAILPSTILYWNRFFLLSNHWCSKFSH